MNTFRTQEDQMRGEQQLRGMAEARMNLNAPQPMPERLTIGNAIADLDRSVDGVTRELESLIQTLGPVLLTEEGCRPSAPAELKGASPVHEMLNSVTRRLRLVADTLADTRRRVDL